MSTIELKISPSILNADWGAFREAINMLEDLGCDLVHIDVMDGHFVPNITVGPALLQHLMDGTDVNFEVHLMVSEPEQWIDLYMTERTETILVHPESGPHVHRCLQKIKGVGAKPGVVLNPGTPLCVLEDLSDYMRHLLLMTVNPGFGGQKFISGMLSKISEARDLLEELGIADDCPIEVDGGMNFETVPQALEAGAQYFVIGASIFLAEDPAKAYKEFNKILRKQSR